VCGAASAVLRREASFAEWLRRLEWLSLAFLEGNEDATAFYQSFRISVVLYFCIFVLIRTWDRSRWQGGLATASDFPYLLREKGTPGQSVRLHQRSALASGANEGNGLQTLLRRHDAEEEDWPDGGRDGSQGFRTLPCCSANRAARQSSHCYLVKAVPRAFPRRTVAESAAAGGWVQLGSCILPVPAVRHNVLR
jgi:hypothetical protein